MRAKAPGNVTALHSLSTHLSPDHALATSVSPGPTSPTVAAAEDLAAAAAAALRVAHARLREAQDGAPTIGPRRAAAEADVLTSRAEAQRRSQAVATRQRAVSDAEGALKAATAAQEDLTEGHRSSTPGGLVSATVKVQKSERALKAARGDVVDAEEARAHAEAALTAAEARLFEVRQESDLEPSGVLAARAKVESAERTLMRAGEALAAARLEAARGVDRPGAPIVTEFASLDAFVEGYVLPNWRHRPSQGNWCASWWQHSEAIARLEAVWEAFEVMRREPAPALSTWWRDHLDTHMRTLTSEDGTFAGCSTTRHESHHQQQEQWRCASPAEGLFHTDPESPRQPSRVGLVRSEGA